MDNTALASALVSQAPDAIIFADREGVIREWNAAAAFLFGYARDEALGQTLDIIIPERFRDAHWRGYRRALADKATKYSGQALPTRAMPKDGSTLYVELTFAIVRDEHDNVLGALAHARDVTERFERQREERRRREAEQPPGQAAQA
jgi:PAS domain S-box-containing protein